MHLNELFCWMFFSVIVCMWIRAVALEYIFDVCWLSSLQMNGISHSLWILFKCYCLLFLTYIGLASKAYVSAFFICYVIIWHLFWWYWQCFDQELDILQLLFGYWIFYKYIISSFLLPSVVLAKSFKVFMQLYCGLRSCLCNFW